MDIETAGVLGVVATLGTSTLAWFGARAKARAAVETAREEAATAVAQAEAEKVAAIAQAESAKEVAKATAAGAVEVARTGAAALLVQPLFERISKLEAKGEVRDGEIDVLSKAVAECQHDREESTRREEQCLQRVEELRGHIKELHGVIHRQLGDGDDGLSKRVELAVKDAVSDEALKETVKETVRATVQSLTPPGSWPLDFDVRDPASRTRSDDPSDDE